MTVTATIPDSAVVDMSIHHFPDIGRTGHVVTVDCLNLWFTREALEAFTHKLASYIEDLPAPDCSTVAVEVSDAPHAEPLSVQGAQ